MSVATNYDVGDTVVGRFSCTQRLKREEAQVTSRYTDHGRPGFLGRNWNPPLGMGPGVWGYDDEIDEVRGAGGKNLWP